MNLRMEVFMKVNGKLGINKINWLLDRDMVEVNKYGKMVQFMKDIGTIM